MKEGFKKCKCRLCGQEDVIDRRHNIETRKWKEKFVSGTWLINEEPTCKRVRSCTNGLELRNMGDYVYKIRSK
jgi:hypothetical protein